MEKIIADYKEVLYKTSADHLILDEDTYSMCSIKAMVENMEGFLDYLNNEDSGEYIEAHEPQPYDEEGDQKRRFLRWQRDITLVEDFIKKYKNINSIKQARLSAGITQQVMADTLEIPLRTIENWETGKRKPPTYVEKLIVEKLNNMRRDDKW